MDSRQQSLTSPSVSDSSIKQRRSTIQPPAKTSLGYNIIHVIWKTPLTIGTKDAVARAKTLLRQLVIFLPFLIIATIIAFGGTSTQQFDFTNGMQGEYLNKVINNADSKGFLSMSDSEEFWLFLFGEFLTGTFVNTYDNGSPVSPSDTGYIIGQSKLIGLVRIRQVAVTNNSCQIPNDFSSYITECYAAYSSAGEDTDGLTPSSTPLSATQNAFNYQTQEQLGGRSFWGRLSTYNGGGYVQDLPWNQTIANQYLTDLSNNLWIQKGTRAVFIDFTLYNPNVNLFCVVKLVVEFPATGAILPTAFFQTLKLLRYESSLDLAVFGLQIVYIVYILYYLGETILEIVHSGRGYFKLFWSWMDIIILIMSFFDIAYNIYSYIAVKEKLATLIANPNQYGNFETLSFWQANYDDAVAVTLFFLWLKLFKYLAFNKTMAQLTNTLYLCAKDIAGFSVMFFLVFFSYAQLGYLLFGSLLFDYSSFAQSSFTLFRIILGDFDFIGIEYANRILGPIYFTTFVFFAFFVLLNMFLAIINDTYRSVADDARKSSDNSPVTEMFKTGWNNIIKGLNFKKAQAQEVHEAMHTADENKDGLVQFQELRAKLAAKGKTDQEIEAIFARYDTDGDKVLNEIEQQLMNEDLKNIHEDLSTQVSEAKKARLSGQAPPQGSGVPLFEINAVKRRVERLEHSLGSVIAKLDAVLVKLDDVEIGYFRQRAAQQKQQSASEA